MTSALSIRNLHKVYDSGFVALKGIDLEVQPGDFFALLGPKWCREVHHDRCDLFSG